MVPAALLAADVQVNDPFRIIFRFQEGQALQVQIVDYHWGVTMLTTATMKRRPTPPGEMLLDQFP